MQPLVFSFSAGGNPACFVEPDDLQRMRIPEAA